MPLGQHGITKISQTQFFHLYGPIGVAGALVVPATGIYIIYNNINIFISKAIYLWYKTFCFTSKKFYNHVLMGERNWILESERRDYGQGEYYLRAWDQLYHYDCYKCCICSRKMNTGEEIHLTQDNRFMCKEDFLANTKDLCKALSGKNSIKLRKG